MLKCADCPLRQISAYFGGHGHSGFAIRCKATNDALFEIGYDEASMLPGDVVIEEWVKAGETSRYYTDDPGSFSLKRVLPSPFGVIQEPRDEITVRWLLNGQECHMSQDQLLERVDEYQGYADDARTQYNRAYEEYERLYREIDDTRTVAARIGEESDAE